MGAENKELLKEFDQLQKENRDTWQAAQELIKAQNVEISKHGETSKETASKVTELHQKQDAIEDNFRALKERLDEYEKKGSRPGFGAGETRRTIGQQLVESDQFKSFVKDRLKNSGAVSLGEREVEDQMLFAKARALQFLQKADPLSSANIGGLVDHFRWDLVQEIRKRPVMITDLLMSMNVDKDVVNYPTETSATELAALLDGAIIATATSAVLKSPGVAGVFIGQTLTFDDGGGTTEDVVVLTVTPATNTITFAAITNPFPDESRVTGTRFGFTPETELKPEGDFNITAVDALIKEIATIIAVTTRMLEDSPLTQQFIDMKLPRRLARSIEYQLLYGAQADPRQLPGILTTPGIQTITQVGPDTKLDVLRRAITLLNLAFFSATGVVMHPNDWEDIELLKATDDHYILNQAPYNPSSPSAVWRVPVVSTPVIAELTFLMGDWADGAMIFNRRDTTITLAREHKDWFQKNLVAVRAERRLGFAVTQTDAWVDGTFI